MSCVSAVRRMEMPENCCSALVAPDAIFDPGDKSRSVILHHLLQARPKLVEQIHARIVPDRRTKVAKRGRSPARPVGAVGHLDGGRTQHPKKVGGVHSSLSSPASAD